MEPIARRTRAGREASMWAKHREWKENEKKEKEKKKKEEKSVVMEVDDEGSDHSLEIVGKKRGRSDEESGKRKFINCRSSDSDFVEVRRNADSDDIQRDRSNKYNKSGKKKSSEEFSIKGTRYEVSDDEDRILWRCTRPNPCPPTKPRKNWKRYTHSERARIEGDGMEAVEEGYHTGDNESSSSEFFPYSEEDLDDSAESLSSDNDSGTDSSTDSSIAGKGKMVDNDYSAESTSSSTYSGSYSHDAAKENIVEDAIMRIFYVGSEEAFRQGKGSVMMVNPYDAMDMDGFISVDKLYEKEEKGFEKKRFGSSWSKHVLLQSDSQPKKKHKQVIYSLSDEDGNGSDQVLKKSEKMWNKKAEKKNLSKKKPTVANIKNTINLLLAKTLSEEDGVSGDLGAPSFDNIRMQTRLPLKFRFKDPAPPPEKEPWEIETDNLFAELNMCLTAIDTADDNVPSTASKEVTEETEETLRTKSPMERCRLGYHEEVLEEPIGIICKCCQFVLTEMKHIFPDLMTPYPKRSNSFYFGKDDFSENNHDYIPVGDSVSENYISTIQTKGSVLELIHPNTRTSMYQHQLDGFVFLWKNVVGETSLEKLKEMHHVQGSGCIISHAPGTGKTCLSIVFIMTLMRTFPYPECRPVVVAPKSMLLTWQHEFEKWDFGFPFHNLNNGDLSGKEIEVSGLSKMVSRQNGRKLGTKYIRKLKLCSWMKQRSILGVSYNLFEKIVNGPEKNFLLEKSGLVVLDEGHTPRNENSCMWKALKEVKTRKRIILSGTPFQNSFKELQTTLHLMNPDFSSKSDLNWKNLKSGKENEDNIAKLKEMIKPLVHVHTGKILEERLPGLKDMLVILRPTIQQKRAFEAISNAPNPFFEKMHLLSLASVHPSLARTKELYSDVEFLDDTNSDLGVKTKFVIQLLRLCDALGEKVLIFCAFIDPLNFLKGKLKEELSWIEGREILYMDGKQEAKMRQSSISSLNDPKSEVKVLLAFTRACSEGIHLIGASRVVLLDVVWNPSVERHVISRAFRLGQKKIVYVYHLITLGILEVHKYEMQTRKHRLAELVFSSQDMVSKKNNINAAVAEDIVLGQMMDDKSLKGIFEEIVHNPKP